MTIFLLCILVSILIGAFLLFDGVLLLSKLKSDQAEADYTRLYKAYEKICKRVAVYEQYQLPSEFIAELAQIKTYISAAKLQLKHYHYNLPAGEFEQTLAKGKSNKPNSFFAQRDLYLLAQRFAGIDINLAETQHNFSAIEAHKNAIRSDAFAYAQAILESQRNIHYIEQDTDLRGGLLPNIKSLQQALYTAYAALPGVLLSHHKSAATIELNIEDYLPVQKANQQYKSSIEKLFVGADTLKQQIKALADCRADYHAISKEVADRMTALSSRRHAFPVEWGDLQTVFVETAARLPTVSEQNDIAKLKQNIAAFDGAINALDSIKERIDRAGRTHQALLNSINNAPIDTVDTAIAAAQDAQRAAQKFHADNWNKSSVTPVDHAKQFRALKSKWVEQELLPAQSRNKPVHFEALDAKLAEVRKAKIAFEARQTVTRKLLSHTAQLAASFERFIEDRKKMQNVLPTIRADQQVYAQFAELEQINLDSDAIKTIKKETFIAHIHGSMLERIQHESSTAVRQIEKKLSRQIGRVIANTRPNYEQLNRLKGANNLEALTDWYNQTLVIPKPRPEASVQRRHQNVAKMRIKLIDVQRLAAKIEALHQSLGQAYAQHQRSQNEHKIATKMLKQLLKEQPDYDLFTPEAINYKSSAKVANLESVLRDYAHTPNAHLKTEAEILVFYTRWSECLREQTKHIKRVNASMVAARQKFTHQLQQIRQIQKDPSIYELQQILALYNGTLSMLTPEKGAQLRTLKTGVTDLQTFLHDAQRLGRQQLPNQARYTLEQVRRSANAITNIDQRSEMLRNLSSTAKPIWLWLGNLLPKEAAPPA